MIILYVEMLIGFQYKRDSMLIGFWCRTKFSYKISQLPFKKKLQHILKFLQLDCMFFILLKHL